MHAVTASNTITVPVENGRSAITLEAGRAYVMHDVEAASGKQADAFEQVAALPPAPRRFDPKRPRTGRMIVPFIGGLGDAVSLLPVLSAIRRRHPRLRIEVATTPGPAEVFDLSKMISNIAPYPMPVADWVRYDHYLTLEAVHETRQSPGRPLPDVFAAAVGVELGVRQFDLTLPRAAEAAAQPSSVPLVAVAVGEGQALRSYPQPMLRELVSLLVRHGLGCVLLGHADPAWNVPVCPPVITDMRSRTPTVLELAVWLRAVDAVVCHDSFVMHLAGALGRPAVALFAPTSSAHAAPYSSAATLSSDVECSPCHEAGSPCPRGHDHCVAWDDDAVKPGAVVNAVLGRLLQQGRIASPAGPNIAAAL
ncbi:MAG: glycosyltransferase family 9 protein [Planctomycetota bacterium]|jgi:ADP-heptose:LPS heptosyltransferase